MPLQRRTQIASLIVIGIMLLSAVIGFGPTWMKSSKPSSDQTQTTNLLELTDNDVSLAINGSSFFVLDFYYPGCGPCKFMNKTISELADELRGQIAFGRMDIKTYGHTAAKYKVQSYPTLIFFNDGVLINRIKGNTSKSDLLTDLKDLKPSLDTSKVQLQAATTSGLPSASISLTKFGEVKPSKPMAITDENIDSAVKQYPYLVVDASTTWCEWCKVMNVTLGDLARELQGQVAFGLIDMDNNKMTKANYNITAYPTMLIFKDGKLADKVVGNQQKSSFVARLKQIDPKLDTSKVQLQAGATSGAPSASISLAKFGEDKPSKPMPITDENIGSAMKQYSYLVVDASTTWCEWCKVMNVTIGDLAKELQGQVAFGLIDMDNNNVTKTNYNITGYPTMLIFKDGKLAGKVVGNQQKSSFVAKLKQIDPKLDTSKVTIVQAPAKPKLTPEQACANMTKSDKPLLEAFVVSKCPFGLQMQRIMANLISQSKDAGNYLKVMYIGSVDNNTITSMHGDEEAKENLRQICIREEQPDRYWNYVSCYMKEGKSTGCLKSASVDTGKLDSCTNITSRGLAYAKKDFDETNKFKITGSPTLLMGDKIVSEFDFATNTTNGRSPEALKELLCCGFNNKPGFCSLSFNKTQAITMFEVNPPAPPKPTPAQVCANMTKSDKPLLEAFVVSRCPFGLQMQRIMANLVNQSNDAENYLKVMYIGSVANNTITSMHGDVEAQENLRQICIREEQSGKYWDYVSCYMKEGKSSNCLKNVSIDVDRLNSCTNDSSRGLAYAQKDFDLANKFSITGSPTLMMGDKKVSEFDFATNTTNGRSPEALKELLCCGFKNEPSFCSLQLNKSRMATMFSTK
jgi:thioredoxin 1